MKASPITNMRRVEMLAKLWSALYEHTDIDEESLEMLCYMILDVIEDSIQIPWEADTE